MPSLPIRARSEDGSFTKKCHLCLLGKEGGSSNCVPARPASDAGRLLTSDGLPIRFLLVGEALGSEEDKAGIPWVGQAGKFLDKILRILRDKGLDLDEVALSNCVRCRPPDNRDPRMQEKRACRRYLDEEIDALEPELMILLGSQAVSSVLDSSTGHSVSKRRLVYETYTTEAGTEVRYACTYHPAAILYDRSKSRPVLEDLHAYLVEHTWEQEDELDRPQTWVMQRPEQMRRLLSRICKADYLGLDIETMGYSAYVLTVAVSFAPWGRAYVVPVYHPEGKLPPKATLESLCSAILDRDDLVVAGQNIKYDLSKMARATGREVIRCQADDCMSFHYMLDEHSGNRSLDYLSRRYTDAGGYKEEIDKGRLHREPLRKVAYYNGTDAALPPKIMQQLDAELGDYGYESPQLVEFYRRAMALASMLEANGMAVDRKALEEAEAVHAKTVAREKTALYRHCPEDLNLNSWQQLSKYIYEDLGLTLPKVKGAITSTGGKSTAAEILEHIPEEHPFLQHLIAYRSASKMKSSYVDSIFEHLTVDGFVYPTYFVVKTHFGGTVSGRWSAKKPPVQTIPKADIVRAAFVSRHGPKGSLWDIDGAQMELRYGAWWAGDEVIREACKGDPHQAMADELRISAEQASKIPGCNTIRDAGKRVNFACVYGVSVSGLVDQGIPEDIAERLVPRVKESWSSLYSALYRIEQQAIREGQVSTPYGAYRRVPNADPYTGKGRHDLRSACNYIIQRPASDLTQILGWRLAVELGDLATVTTSTHDSITLDVAPGNKRAAYKIVRGVCTEQWKVDVEEILGMDLGDFPFVWEVSHGDNWLEQRDKGAFSC